MAVAKSTNVLLCGRRNYWEVRRILARRFLSLYEFYIHLLGSVWSWSPQF